MDVGEFRREEVPVVVGFNLFVASESNYISARRHGAYRVSYLS